MEDDSEWGNLKKNVGKHWNLLQPSPTYARRRKVGTVAPTPKPVKTQTSAPPNTQDVPSHWNEPQPSSTYARRRKVGPAAPTPKPVKAQTPAPPNTQDVPSHWDEPQPSSTHAQQRPKVGSVAPTPKPVKTQASQPTHSGRRPGDAKRMILTDSLQDNHALDREESGNVYDNKGSVQMDYIPFDPPPNKRVENVTPPLPNSGGYVARGHGGYPPIPAGYAAYYPPPTHSDTSATITQAFSTPGTPAPTVHEVPPMPLSDVDAMRHQLLQVKQAVKTAQHFGVPMQQDSIDDGTQDAMADANAKMRQELEDRDADNLKRIEEMENEKRRGLEEAEGVTETERDPVADAVYNKYLRCCDDAKNEGKTNEDAMSECKRMLPGHTGYKLIYGREAIRQNLYRKAASVKAAVEDTSETFKAVDDVTGGYIAPIAKLGAMGALGYLGTGTTGAAAAAAANATAVPITAAALAAVPTVPTQAAAAAAAAAAVKTTAALAAKYKAAAAAASAASVAPYALGAAVLGTAAYNAYKWWQNPKNKKVAGGGTAYDPILRRYYNVHFDDPYTLVPRVTGGGPSGPLVPSGPLGPVSHVEHMGALADDPRHHGLTLVASLVVDIMSPDQRRALESAPANTVLLPEQQNVVAARVTRAIMWPSQYLRHHGAPGLTREQRVMLTTVAQGRVLSRLVPHAAFTRVVEGEPLVLTPAQSKFWDTNVRIGRANLAVHGSQLRGALLHAGGMT